MQDLATKGLRALEYQYGPASEGIRGLGYLEIEGLFERVCNERGSAVLGKSEDYTRIVREQGIEPLGERVIHDAEGRWWTGQINRSSAALEGQSLPKRVTLVDSTLREGEDMGGISLSGDQKLEIAVALQDAGFREMEVGYVGAIRPQFDFVRRLRKETRDLRLHSLCRIYTRDGEWEREIDKAVEAGVDCVRFVIFGAPSLGQSVPWLPPEAIPERVYNAVSYALKLGVETNVTVSGLVKMDLATIWTTYQVAALAGSSRVMLGDGIGGASPEAFRFLVRFVRSAIGDGPTISLHCHNTLGLATANALAGVLAGAEVVDVVPTGVGDSAGITAAEQVVLALEVLYGIETGINVSKIRTICHIIAGKFGIEMPPHSPIIGGNIYNHANDNHIASILRGGWATWELINPDALGATRAMAIPAGMLRSGRSGTLDAVVEQLGREVSEEEYAGLHAEAEELARLKGQVSVSDLIELVNRRTGRIDRESAHAPG